MSIKHEPTLKRYKELRRENLSALTKVSEFAESLPGATNSQLALHYGHIGPLDLRERLREATVCAETLLTS